jgi:hypothetical protein
LVLKVWWALRDHKDFKDTKVFKDQLVLKDLKVSQLLVLKVQQAHQDRKVLKVLVVQQE